MQTHGMGQSPIERSECDAILQYIENANQLAGRNKVEKLKLVFDANTKKLACQKFGVWDHLKSFFSKEPPDSVKKIRVALANRGIVLYDNSLESLQGRAVQTIKEIDDIEKLAEFQFEQLAAKLAAKEVKKQRKELAEMLDENSTPFEFYKKLQTMKQTTPLQDAITSASPFADSNKGIPNTEQATRFRDNIMKDNPTLREKWLQKVVTYISDAGPVVFENLGDIAALLTAEEKQSIRKNVVNWVRENLEKINNSMLYENDAVSHDQAVASMKKNLAQFDIFVEWNNKEKKFFLN